MDVYNEPWEYFGKHGRIEAIAHTNDKVNNSYCIAEFLGPNNLQNAQRAVLCVNACAGMRDEEVEQLPILQTLYKKALKERDQFFSDADKLITHGVALKSQLDEAVAGLRFALAMVSLMPDTEEREHVKALIHKLEVKP